MRSAICTDPVMAIESAGALAEASTISATPLLMRKVPTALSKTVRPPRMSVRLDSGALPCAEQAPRSIDPADITLRDRELRLAVEAANCLQHAIAGRLPWTRTR